MKAFLNFRTDDEYPCCRSKTVECKELIIKDGKCIDADADGSRTYLLDVVASEGIFVDVASIEIL